MSSYYGSEAWKQDQLRQMELMASEWERTVRNWANEVYRDSGLSVSELENVPFEELADWYNEAHAN